MAREFGARLFPISARNIQSWRHEKPWLQNALGKTCVMLVQDAVLSDERGSKILLHRFPMNVW